MSNARQALTSLTLLGSDFEAPRLGRPGYTGWVWAAPGRQERSCSTWGRTWPDGPDARHPHDPAPGSPTRLPYAFDPAADCPTWEKGAARPVWG